MATVWKNEQQQSDGSDLRLKRSRSSPTLPPPSNAAPTSAAAACRSGAAAADVAAATATAAAAAASNFGRSKRARLVDDATTSAGGATGKKAGAATVGGTAAGASDGTEARGAKGRGGAAVHHAACSHVPVLMDYPMDVAALDDGRLAVADRDNCVVRIISLADGGFTTIPAAECVAPPSLIAYCKVCIGGETYGETCAKGARRYSCSGCQDIRCSDIVGDIGFKIGLCGFVSLVCSFEIVLKLSDGSMLSKTACVIFYDPAPTFPYFLSLPSHHYADVPNIDFRPFWSLLPTCPITTQQRTRHPDTQ
jgi:hypothetical protein